ncbi:MAG: hypothetical protein GY754_34755 [bacterium]|nr:hypothetical protein [bacterium]
METIKKINICQPGHNASCALCCGSHNYNDSHNSIARIFRHRTGIFNNPDNIPRENSTSTSRHTSLDDRLKQSSSPKRFDDGIQCHFVGYLNNREPAIGCLAYSNKDVFLPEQKCFFSKTCRSFSCLAREILSDIEILFAAKLMRDWFYYSLFINDINILKDTCKNYKTPENLPGNILESIKKELDKAIA